MNDNLASLLVFAIFIMIRYWFGRISIEQWKQGTDEEELSQEDIDYFSEGGPIRNAFYKKFFYSVFWIVIVALLVFFHQEGNLRMQQIMITIIALWAFFEFFIIFNVFVILRNRVKEAASNVEKKKRSHWKHSRNGKTICDSRKKYF